MEFMFGINVSISVQSMIKLYDQNEILYFISSISGVFQIFNKSTFFIIPSPHRTCILELTRKPAYGTAATWLIRTKAPLERNLGIC